MRGMLSRAVIALVPGAASGCCSATMGARGLLATHEASKREARAPMDTGVAEGEEVLQV